MNLDEHLLNISTPLVPVGFFWQVFLSLVTRARFSLSVLD